MPHTRGRTGSRPSPIARLQGRRDNTGNPFHGRPTGEVFCELCLRTFPMRLTSLLFFLLVMKCVAAPPPTERTVAGLDAEVYAAWTSVPLRAWAEGAAALAGRPVILDRRVDPTQPVTITVRGKPVREVLALVAADAGAAVALREARRHAAVTAAALEALLESEALAGGNFMAD